jgi:high-affinity nickel-transport protein
MLIATGLGAGLIVSSLLLGMRHGVDWDHIAAITDLSATQDSPRHGVRLGVLYALGHGAVVLAIGTAVIVAGRSLPDAVDALFGRIVGWTLILLGLYVLWSLWVHRDGFRMESRWMLAIRGVKRLVARIRGEGAVTHDHPHAGFEDVHHDADQDSHGDGSGRVHSHPHTHDVAGRTSVGVGMLHGVGAETPTQVVTFLAAAQAGGVAAGMVVLVTFLVGLFASNTVITVASAYGFREASRRRSWQMGLGAVTAVVSLVVGVLFALGQDATLPAFFAG